MMTTACIDDCYRQCGSSMTDSLLHVYQHGRYERNEQEASLRLTKSGVTDFIKLTPVRLQFDFSLSFSRHTMASVYLRTDNSKYYHELHASISKLH